MCVVGANYTVRGTFTVIKILSSVRLAVLRRSFSLGKVRFNFVHLLNLLAVHCFYVIAWDNLRIDVYGFRELAAYFFEKHPGYFLSPLRISGSAVETLFGQYKYMSGSKLDASNYHSCRSKYLVKQAVHHSGQFYRDQKLNIPIAPLEKKKYGNSKS